MNYSVIWHEIASDQLADIYVAATPEERSRIAAGVEALLQRLAREPFSEGESRSGNDRVVFVPLLSIGFHVNPTSAVVRVVDVKRYGR